MDGKALAEEFQRLWYGDQGDISDALVEQILSALRAGQWRPIDEAPKDGSLIIAWCVHTNAKYAKDPIGEGWAAPVIAQWIDHNGGGWTWHGLAGVFTHYMPLPTPPTEKG